MLEEATITKGVTKRLIMDLLQYTDSVKPEGGREPRLSIPKKVFRGYRELKAKILGSVEIGICPVTAITPDDIKASVTWMPMEFGTEFKCPDGHKIVAERYRDNEIVLEKKEIEALKFFYEDREEILDCDVSVIDEIEGIAGIS